MGRYIKWDDVVNRYKKFGDIVDSQESQETYIQYAESYVDAGLAKAYTIPFSNNNVTVRDLSIDTTFAKALMFKDSEKATAILTYVGSYMGALSDGSMVMVTNSGDQITPTGEPVYSQTMDYTPVFGKGSVSDMRVDSAQLYDEEIDRGD